MHDVLGPLGVDQALSRRVAGALLKAESELPATLAPEPSFFRDVLRKFARTPSALSSQAAGETNSNYGTLESGNTPATAAVEGSDSDCDVGMTAFLLKFAEQAEDVPTSRLFLCKGSPSQPAGSTIHRLQAKSGFSPRSTAAFTIAAGYALGGILPCKCWKLVSLLSSLGSDHATCTPSSAPLLLHRVSQDRPVLVLRCYSGYSSYLRLVQSLSVCESPTVYYARFLKADEAVSIEQTTLVCLSCRGSCLCMSVCVDVIDRVCLSTGAEIGFSGYAKGCLSTLAVGAAAAAASWCVHPTSSLWLLIRPPY